MLKIYTNTEVLTEYNRSRVFPLLFDLYYVVNDELSKHYKIVDDINSADIIVFPLEYTYCLKHNNALISTFFNSIKSFKKPVWIYTGGDFGYTLKEDYYNFRLGGFKSKLDEKSIIMPSFINDPYSSFLKGNKKIIKKEKLSKIGFVGHAKGGFLKYTKELISYLKLNTKRLFKKVYSDYQPFYPSSVKRAKYLKLLQTNNQIEANFILREHYRAGVKTNEEKQETSKAFYNNIFENPYTFCMRGGGNFSVRFYETLAVGRIPVLLNTDCQLPLQINIDWTKHCVITNDDSMLTESLINFHNKISDSDFEAIQENNRILWENYLTRESFFKVIHDEFETIINKNESA